MFIAVSVVSGRQHAGTGAYGGDTAPMCNGWLSCVARALLWIGYVTLVTGRLVVVVLIGVANKYPTPQLTGALGV